MTRDLAEALRRNGYTDRKAAPVPAHWPREVDIPGDGPAQWWCPTDSPREHVYVANGRPFRVTFDRAMAPVAYAVLNTNGAGWVGRFPVTPERNPRSDGNGATVWACCTSIIGPACEHRREAAS